MGGQTVIEGMGELHLEIIVDRTKREFSVEANVGAPQVAYREAITSSAEVDYIHKKQSGGSGQYARVKIQFDPKEYIPGVQKGIRSILGEGVVAGFPVLGLKATL